MSNKKKKYLFFKIIFFYSYKGKDMLAAHKGMGINDLHFNAVKECLVNTLVELGID
jgi:hypothetical protein